MEKGYWKGSQFTQGSVLVEFLFRGWTEEGIGRSWELSAKDRGKNGKE